MNVRGQMKCCAVFDGNRSCSRIQARIDLWQRNNLDPDDFYLTTFTNVSGHFEFSVEDVDETTCRQFYIKAYSSCVFDVSMIEDSGHLRMEKMRLLCHYKEPAIYEMEARYSNSVEMVNKETLFNILKPVKYLID